MKYGRHQTNSDGACTEQKTTSEVPNVVIQLCCFAYQLKVISFIGCIMMLQVKYNKIQK